MDEVDAAKAVSSVARELGAAGGRCSIALSRTDAVLKTIPLPEGLPDHERPAYVRLQMERQLPFPVEQAAIDYVEAPNESSGLLAAAVRRDALTRAQGLAKDAGFKGCDVVLIDEGLARLLAPVGDRGEGVLGVFVCEGRCEIIIARDGRLLMSRACELSEEFDEATSTVVTEARRTLMSYRVRPDAVPVRTGALLCDAETEIAMRAELEPMLELGSLERIETGAPENACPACARLAGVLALGDERIDFSSPTTAPDRNARVRQLAMLAVLAVIVVVGGAITMGLRSKRAMQSELDGLQAEVTDANRTALGLIRASGRLEHARSWAGSGADWGAHLALIAPRLPGGERVLLDRLSMSADAEVDYDNRRGRAYSDERWQTGTQVVMGLGARATDADVLRGLRESLIALDAYTLTPVGEDTVDGGEGRYPVVGGVTLTSRERAPSDSDDTEGGTDG
ncbi:MAG: hypothetical protein Tsb0013_08630 [Phycisphaerales bacterium]